MCGNKDAGEREGGAAQGHSGGQGTCNTGVRRDGVTHGEVAVHTQSMAPAPRTTHTP